MYGVIAAIFIFLLALTYYKISTYDSQPYFIGQVPLNKHISRPQYDIYATCIDKKKLSQNLLADIKVMSSSLQSFAVLFQNNPLLQCQQLTYSLDLTLIDSKTPQIQFQKIIMLKAFTGQTQIKHLSKGQYLKVNSQKQFVLILTLEKTFEEKETSQQNIKQGIEAMKISVGVENDEYLQNVLSSVFWFSWFNLIGISLISYYRKNVFNTKVQLFSSLTILLYLIWLSFNTLPSLHSLEKQLKLAMICFILLLCIKTQLNLSSTLLILFISIGNQVCLQLEMNILVQWIIYGINLLFASFIVRGHNNEVMSFSLFSFFVACGLVNPYLDTIHPFTLSLILTNLIFGPTIYELLQLRRDLIIQVKRTQQKLKSYEVSETDQLFVN